MSQHQDATKPLFSVIIPLFNKAPYIRRAIDSVLSQTVQDFEIIVVNDGSTDGGEEIVAKYLDSRIILVNQENGGVSVARNTGIGMAQSEFIAFLDADDEWLPSFLNEILIMIDEFPDAALFATAVELVYGHRVERHNHFIPTFTGVLNYSESPIELRDYFKTCVLMGYSPITSSSHVVKKSILQAIGNYNPTSRLSEDLEVWGKIAYAGFPIIYSYSIQSRVHVVADNKATDRFFVQDHSPFVNYILNLPVDLDRNDSDVEWLRKYVSSLEILAAFNNIGAGNIDGAKNNLNYVRGVEYQTQKNILSFCCYLPFNMGRFAPIFYNFLKKRKLFQAIFQRYLL